METAIERFTGISFLVVGLSHLLRPAGWAEYFAQLRARGEPGAFINGMMSVAMGAFIVSFHGDQWTGWPAVVTAIGWGQLLKGAVHMSFPAHSLRSMAWVTPEKSYKFAVAGGLMIPLALVIIAKSFR